MPQRVALTPQRGAEETSDAAQSNWFQVLKNMLFIHSDRIPYTGNKRNTWVYAKIMKYKLTVQCM